MRQVPLPGSLHRKRPPPPPAPNNFAALFVCFSYNPIQSHNSVSPRPPDLPDGGVLPSSFVGGGSAPPHHPTPAPSIPALSWGWKMGIVAFGNLI